VGKGKGGREDGCRKGHFPSLSGGGQDVRMKRRKGSFVAGVALLRDSLNPDVHWNSTSRDYESRPAPLLLSCSSSTFMSDSSRRPLTGIHPFFFPLCLASYFPSSLLHRTSWSGFNLCLTTSKGPSI
jgi:hypothetical protein